MAAKTKTPLQLTTVPTSAPVFDPEAGTVALGRKRYLIREMPLGRIKRFKTFFVETINALTGAITAGDEEEDQVTLVLDLITAAPFDLLQHVLVDLDEDVFLDEEEGATVPQIFDAFEAVLARNRLGFLKSMVPFFLDLLQKRASRVQAEATQRQIEQAVAAIKLAQEAVVDD